MSFGDIKTGTDIRVSRDTYGQLCYDLFFNQNLEEFF